MPRGASSTSWLGLSGFSAMLIKVHVTPSAKESRVVKLGEADYDVRVDEAAAEGRANKRLVEILSEHFGVKKSRIVIQRGATSRDKIVEVDLMRSPPVLRGLRSKGTTNG